LWPFETQDLYPEPDLQLAGGALGQGVFQQGKVLISSTLLQTDWPSWPVKEFDRTDSWRWPLQNDFQGFIHRTLLKDDRPCSSPLSDLLRR
jgi:hypothetical protein